MNKNENLKKIVAIIGGNGFIGKNFTQYFSESGYKIKCIDRHFDSVDDCLNTTSELADIHHTKELISVLQNVDYVMWLVHASVPSTLDDSLVDDFELNIAPLIKFLEAAKVKLPTLKKFIYLSSGGTIYGDTELKVPILETNQQNPISNYGMSKAIAERYINYLTEGANFESFILRPSNVYGMYQNLIKPQGIIGFAFKSIYDKKQLNLYDNGQVVRDFVYVLDLAKAIGKCLLREGNVGFTTCYNVGSNEGLTIRQVLDKVEKLTNSKLVFNHMKSREFDCQYNVLDTSKIRKELSWDIETNIEEGLFNVWEWIRKSDKK